MTMALNNSFQVPTSVEETWRTLLDVERVALCLPGAQLETMDGDTFTGRVKVKLGPITMSFKGSARFTERDAEHHRAVLSANGKEIGGMGTASAVMTMQVVEAASGTGSEVSIGTDLAITGKAARFGRGIIAEVAGRLVTQFATALTAQLVGSEADGVRTGPGDVSVPDAARAGRPRQQEEAFRLLAGTGSGVAHLRDLVQLTPRGGAIAALLALFILVGRRRPPGSPIYVLTYSPGVLHD